MSRSLLLGLLIVLSSPACVVVGGYSSEGGWFIWPGSLILMALLVAIFLFMRRRR